ncbi:MAG: hypothetical protein SFU86_00370 [Pirellulaceae bacterium]|nr:hypothetical protein [Pirellulaceae bacterium]
MEVMSPEYIQALGADIRRERIERARRQQPGDKFLDALKLFDFACSWTKAGIRSQFPEADEEEVSRILRERLEQQRRRDEPQWKPGCMLLP